MSRTIPRIIVHTFGDSHAKIPWMFIKDKKFKICVHHLGPKLMHSFGRDGLEALDISDPRWGVKEGHILCFSYGEIDCRCHVHRYLSTGYKKTIKKLVKNYFRAIKTNIDKLGFPVKVCVQCPPPACLKATAVKLKEYPYLGSDNKRRSYRSYMCKCIYAACKDSQYYYMDFFKQTSTKTGFLRKDVRDCCVHIQIPKFHLIFLRKHFC